MIKLIKPFVLFGILVLFFGCVIDVKVEQAINKDGSAQLTQIVDFASFVSYAESMQESVKPNISAMETAFSESCKNITKKDSKVECKYENKKLVLSTIIQPNADYKFNKDEGLFETTYKVIIKTIPQLSNENISLGNRSIMATPTEKQYFKDGMSANMTVAKSLFKMTYVVTMPANIENASLGKISEDKRSVTYDTYELYDKKQDIEIIAKEENTLIKYAIIGGAVSVFIIIIGIMLFKFVLMRKK